MLSAKGKAELFLETFRRNLESLDPREESMSMIYCGVNDIMKERMILEISKKMQEDINGLFDSNV